jgi:hypothetical protein
MPETKTTYITLARAMGDNPGAIAPGHYVVADDVVTLTDQAGVPIASGRMQLGYSSKLGDEETADQVAKRLLWRHHRATKSGSDFNRRITYPASGIA